ncbi:MAG: SAF domain-containing protein [Acidimicrobiales bacterium]
MATTPLKLSPPLDSGNRSPNGARPAPEPAPGATAPSRRRLVPVLAGVVIAGLTIATAAALAPKSVPMRQVLVAAAPLAPGTALTSADWRVVVVPAADHIDAMGAANAHSLVGKTASVSWSPGTPISATMVGAVAPSDVIGLSLRPGQAPAGLVPGDHVIVVAMSSSATTTTPAMSGYLLGVVGSVAPDSSTGDTQANVSVSTTPTKLAEMIAAASAGDVAVVADNG